MLKIVFLSFFLFGGSLLPLYGQQVTIITEDIDRFWQMWDMAYPDFDPSIIDKLYLKPGSKGIKGFTKNRIESAENLSRVIKKNLEYYESIRESTLRIASMKPQIEESFAAFAKQYPKAIFPPVYFVIGVMNSGGTTSINGIIIGAEMYGVTDQTNLSQLGKWHKEVLKPVEAVPYIVAHELIHIQQKKFSQTLLASSLKEGSADFLGEMISGKHINQNVHDFANPREEELWLEFESRMNGSDLSGWLYSSQEGRPNDLGYWMGYQISKAYYDQASDQTQAISDILRIKDPMAFLEQSGYKDQFESLSK